MKKTGVLLVFSLFLLQACAIPQQQKPSIQDDVVITSNYSSTPSSFKIASWNIQVFGLAKSSNPIILSKIADRIDDFDMVAIQEIRDSSGEAVQLLLNSLKGGKAEWGVVLSPRVGRTHSKEQYAVFYNKSVFTPQGFFMLPDPNDHFEREPMLANFTVGNWSFTLVVAHLKPKGVGLELPDLSIYLTSNYDSTPTILVGDLNADCEYWDESRNNWWYWVVPNSADTTVSNGTDCAYDRIVVNLPASFRYRPLKKWGVINVSADESDHNMVWAQFVVA